MRVPFVDLKAQYATIKDEIDAAIAGVVERCAFVLGPAVGEFEENFARFCGVKHCVAVSSGTSALHCALTAVGVRSLTATPPSLEELFLDVYRAEGR